jgi:thiol-disulfide isomerase/thioredoxin
MNRAVRKYAIAAAAVTIAAAVVIHLVLFTIGPSAQLGANGRMAEVPMDALPRAAVAFTPLDQPRSLPEFRIIDDDGRTLSMADFSGRLVLLNLWATWCVPCRREMPSLDRLQAAFDGTDFDVVALSLDRKGVPVVRAFYDEFAIAALDLYVAKSSTVTRALGVIGLPTTLLVDRTGRELGRVVGPAEWDSPEFMALVRRYLEQPVVKTAAYPHQPNAF